MSLVSRTSHAFACRTHLGLVKSINQDAYLYSIRANSNIFIVCDGVSGSPMGEVASALAAREFLEGYGTAEDSDGCPLTAGVARANASLITESQKYGLDKPMRTTLSALVLTADKAAIAHVGDSRIYRLRDGDLVQLTDDHTRAADAVLNGDLSPDEAEGHPLQEYLTRSLGRGPVTPEIRFYDLQKDDRFLLCTDGLTGHVSDQCIRDVLRGSSPEDACEQLIEHALKDGGRDNCTVLVVGCN